MILSRLLLAFRLLISLVVGQGTEKLPLDIGQSFVLECLQRDEDGEASPLPPPQNSPAPNALGNGRQTKAAHIHTLPKMQ